VISGCLPAIFSTRISHYPPEHSRLDDSIRNRILVLKVCNLSACRRNLLFADVGSIPGRLPCDSAVGNHDVLSVGGGSHRQPRAIAKPKPPSVFLFGMPFCLFLRRRGTLWGLGFHAGWDWGRTFFYGAPGSGLKPYHDLCDSFLQPAWLTGGTVGPEARVFTPIVPLIVAIIFARVYGNDL
jgi:hypothetical protein